LLKEAHSIRQFLINIPQSPSQQHTISFRSQFPSSAAVEDQIKLSSCASM
jgi:hypothetical protein